MAKILHRGDTSDGLMRGEGKFVIVESKAGLMSQLMDIELAGRVCYRSKRAAITFHSAEDFVRKLLKRGHWSVIEHTRLMVIFTNISRGFTHEMVRHRLIAASQESTRYTDYAGGKLDLEEAELTFVVPPHQELLGAVDYGITVESMVSSLESQYKLLRKNGWPPQDARQFLPIGIAAKIAVTANWREWRHIFAMRTQKAAHWEIRYMMCDLLTKLKTVIPVIFEDFYREPVYMVGHGGKRTVCPDKFQTDKDGYAYYVQNEKWPEKGDKL